MKKTFNTTRRAASTDSLLYYLRAWQGLSQQKLAETCDVSLRVIRSLEKQNFRVYSGSACKVAQHLGISIDALIHNSYKELISCLPSMGELKQLRQKVRLELHRKQAHREEIGDRGEDIVAKNEKEKLRGSGFENAVNVNYAADTSAGFDIFSFTMDGQPLHIEVKTTEGGADTPFFLSTNELEFVESCAANGLNYQLHRIYNLKNDSYDVKVYTAEELLSLFYTASEYKVYPGKVVGA